MFYVRIIEYYKKHKRFFPFVFFLVGFLFDVFTIQRIDSLNQILGQSFYLFLIALLLLMILRDEHHYVPIPKFLNKVWKYNQEALHFLLGSLLSKYTIFFFKSASLTTSFIFIIFLVTLMVINEFVRLKKDKIILYFILYSLCFTSFWIHIIPTLMKYIGYTPFMISLLVSFSLFYIYFLFLDSNMKIDLKIRRNILLSFMSVEATFAILYTLQILPPLPLSLQYIGIFHDLKKADGKYVLSYTRPIWKFWQNGDQTFYARPGDKVFAFVRVFSPTGFHDQLKVRWLYETKKGWEPQDAIPIQINGGRNEGFRGYTVKNNYVPGHWRVQIETNDAREVGRINLNIIADNSNKPRNENVEIH